ncbi:MAG: metallophosphoesterase [Lachnospiraceae bacterium]|nr:metallophosphoesterase [Lachnospiraceae bacterium]MBR1450416.1 metallophosphoesterase [Lachnospiraceae bacterium]
MKVLILSDTHGYNDTMYEVIDREAPFDMLIHCGDLEGAYDELRTKVNCTLHVVAGNNDYDPDMDRVRVFDIGKYKAVLTHGHRYRLYSDLSPLFYLAVENHADFVFFGHTHVPMIKEEGPVTLINPGSLTYPRQHGRKPSYIVGTIEDGSNPVFEVRYL